jgi:hypothetical protein
MLVTLPNPISEFQHALLPLKVLRARECALTLCFSAVFSLDSHVSPLKSLGVCQMPHQMKGIKDGKQDVHFFLLKTWGTMPECNDQVSME